MENSVQEKLVQHYQMINVSDKKATLRKAIAQGEIFVGAQAFQLIKQRKLPKGDALLLAEIAGISGAKKAYDLIPLCHPLSLDHVSILTELNEEDSKVIVYCIAVATAKTGVEMEALAGVNAALLTIYDLTKMIQPALTLTNIRLLIKEGGKTQLWQHPDGIPHSLQNLFPETEKKLLLTGVRTATITLSDRANAHYYTDEAGLILHHSLLALGADVFNHSVLPDSKEALIQHIKQLITTQAPQLIITTGGTGLSARDVTPEALTTICERIIPGLGELLRYASAKLYTEFSWLSRCLAGSIGNTLIIALPGKPKAVSESIDILKNVLPHALMMLNEGNHDQL